MFRLQQSVVLAIAEETRTAVTATDSALHAGAQLLVSLIEGAATTELPISVTQKLYAQAHAHSSMLVEGRQGLCELITSMSAVKGNSDQRETAIGCPKGPPSDQQITMPDFFTGATLAPGATTG